MAIGKYEQNMNAVTFKEFSELMTRRRHDVDALVHLFRGKLEDPREFFERVMSCKYKYEDRSEVVIPYRCVLEFYEHELHYFRDTMDKRQRLCRCGCGKPVFGQRKFAAESCRKRIQRTDVAA